MMTDDFPLMRLSGHSMGTTWSVLAGEGLGERAALTATVHHDLQATLVTLVAQMSHWEPGSLLSRINRAPPGWYQVPPEFFAVITCALDVACATDGAYDPTVGELVQLWGFGAQGTITRPPAAQALAAARARAGWDKLQLDAEHSALWQPGNVTLDFSAIAKGYGVDAMAAVLERHGIANYVVELGGELRARGVRPDGAPWRLQIETPDTAESRHKHGIPIALHNRAIATSGDTRRYFIHQGQRYAHTIDPRTGWALANDLASVSVIHTECMLADALSTALLCLGWDAGLALAYEHDIAALFLRRNHDDFAIEWTDAFFRAARPDTKDTSA